MSGGIQADVGQGTLSARRAGPLMVIEQGDVTAASDDVTVHLGGEEATGAAGTLTPGFGLAGEAGTGAAGTLGPEWSGALTGSAMTMAQGFVGTAQEAEDTFATSSTGSIASVEFDITASGTAATPAQGDLSVTNVVLAGQLALAQHYTIYGSFDVGLTGIELAVSQGVMVSSGGTEVVIASPVVVPPYTGGGWQRERTPSYDEFIRDRLKTLKKEKKHAEKEVQKLERRVKTQKAKAEDGEFAAIAQKLSMLEEQLAKALDDLYEIEQEEIMLLAEMGLL